MFSGTFTHVFSLSNFMVGINCLWGNTYGTCAEIVPSLLIVATISEINNWGFLSASKTNDVIQGSLLTDAFWVIKIVCIISDPGMVKIILEVLSWDRGFGSHIKLFILNCSDLVFTECNHSFFSISMLGSMLDCRMISTIPPVLSTVYSFLGILIIISGSSSFWHENKIPIKRNRWCNFFISIILIVLDWQCENINLRCLFAKLQKLLILENNNETYYYQKRIMQFIWVCTVFL